MAVSTGPALLLFLATTSRITRPEWPTHKARRHFRVREKNSLKGSVSEYGAESDAPLSQLLLQALGHLDTGSTETVSSVE